MNQQISNHWADITANRIIKDCGDKEIYTLASGITPSGVVHFGNFRETITVDMVARALRDRGKKVRFFFSWDDYDTFRKIPKNMPKQEELTKYLFHPIVDTPDPFGRDESYAAHHEKNYEGQLHRVDIYPEPIYQAEKYKNGHYKEDIKKALKNRDAIVAILNKHRTEPLADSWMPISVYCEKCNRDKTDSNVKYDGDHHLSYTCDLCNHQGTLDLNTTSLVKLPWRVDWPMRWVYEKVDFEPGGKDHSSEGGSFSTAKEIVNIFGGKAPLYLQYEFVSIKGGAGKMSSSSGEVVTLEDVLKIYEPEIIRWIFASYRSNVEFSISFDLDVLKTYEDFDRQERLAFGVEAGNEGKVAIAKRVYQLSTVGGMPDSMPFQPSFRHLCNVLQTNDGNIEKAKEFYKDEIKNERDQRRFLERSNCALYWIENYAPEDFKFSLNKTPVPLEMDETQKIFLSKLKGYLTEHFDNLKDDKELHEKIYEFINELKAKDETLDPGHLFSILYKILISKEKGPKLASFIRLIGKNKVLELLSGYDLN